MTPNAEAWIELLLKRGAELRSAGVLSIGVDGLSAVLAPAGPDDGCDDDEVSAIADEPSDPWKNPASYPSGEVPSIGEVDDATKLPEIHDFEDP